MKRNIAKALAVSFAMVAVMMLASCASSSAPVVDVPVVPEAKPASMTVPYETSYELVGYKVIYSIDADAMTFTFLDAMSDKEIEATAQTIMKALEQATGYTLAAPGKLVFALESIPTQQAFDSMVSVLNQKIYDYIY